MLKFVYIVFIAFIFVACGVETSSSDKTISSTIIPTTPDDGTTTPDDGTTTPDDGTTTPDDGTTTPDDGTTIPDVNSVFDTVGAIYDVNGCNSSSYRIATDSSTSGELDGENGSSAVQIVGQGLVIRSEYLDVNLDRDSQWVTLFYKGFPSSVDLDLQGITSYTMEDVFYLSYDLAWADESISGIDNRMYIQSNKGEKPACYRLDLDDIIGSNITVQKVYR